MEDDHTSGEAETVILADPPALAEMLEASADDPAALAPHHSRELDELVGRWDEQYRMGQEPELESICGNDSPLLRPLCDRVAKLKKLYAVLDLSPIEARAGEPPPEIPGHEVLGEIGRGGMGIVYKARDLTLGRLVAIKTIAEGRHATADQRDRFRAEAQAVARLRHPNIIAIHAIGEHDERPYLSLECAEGGSLSRRLAAEPMDPREAGVLVETLARAVHAAHQAGVVHRDLKPSNILLTADGVPKVSDFGLAKLMDADSSRTVSGQVLGSPSYMAPEQAEGHAKRVGPATDIYALGAILYQALTGRPPFLGASKLETLKLVTSADVLPPGRLRPGVPRDLETICLNCLEKSPVKRYATALELADDLGRFRRDEPILARRIGAFRRSLKWTRRHPWQSLSAAIVAMAVATFIGLTYRHNLQLRAEIGRTEAKAAEARRNYQAARSAIQAILARLNDRRFAGTPQMMELGRDQKEDALAFYDRILGQVDSNDPVVRADAARALGEASVLENGLGQIDRAEKSVRRALDLIRSVRTQHPDNLEYMVIHTECLLRLGSYLTALNRIDPAIDAGRQSVELAERVHNAAPENIIYQEQLALCYTNFANALWGSKNASEALMHYRKATGIRQNIDPAQLPGVIQRRALSVLNEGVMLWNQKLHPHAEERFREAERLLFSVPSDHRDAAEPIDITLGQIYVNWSGMLHLTGRFQESIDRADAGLNRVEPYLKIEPNDAGARHVNLALHGNRAYALTGQGKHHESAKEWTRVVELSPQPVPPEHRISLAFELLSAGDFASALAQARLVQPTPGISGEVCYNMACFFTRYAAELPRDRRVPADRHAQVVNAHITEALRWLKAAADAGLFAKPEVRDQARKDSDLVMLRKRPEFDQVVQSSGARR